MITKFRGSHYYVSWLLNINQLPEIQWMLKNGYDWKQATSKDTSNGLCFPEDGVYDTNLYKVWVAYPPPPWLERIRELVSQLTASSGSAQADPEVRANRVSEEP